MLSFCRIEIPRDNETFIKFRSDSYSISFSDESLFGSNNSYLKKILERSIKYPDGLVIVEIDGKPVGQIELQIKQFENEDIGYVNLFYLIAECRGQGYGAKLIEYAKNFFRNTHIEEMNGLGFDDLKKVEEKIKAEGLNIEIAYDTSMVEI